MSQRATEVRLSGLDAVRGLAIAAMISFHATWDLAYFGYISTDLLEYPLFRLYGHAIATTFLILVGVSLVLAFRRADPWQSYWARITKITSGAILITLATRYFMPHEFIFFGILHCIILSSLLALPFLRAPLFVVAVFDLLAFGLPLFVALPALDAPGFWWLGLGTKWPVSNDIQPFLPWFGMVLSGILLARSGWLKPLAGPALPVLPRLFSKMGRYSLSLYLVHQPLLFAAFLVIETMTGPKTRVSNNGIIHQCETQCQTSGRDTNACKNGCVCFANQIKSNGLWQKAQANNLTPSEQHQIIGFAKICVRVQDERAAPQ